MLPFILTCCLQIVGIRSLEPGTPGRDVQVHRRRIVRSSVNPIEQIFGIAIGMKGPEFRCIQKTLAIDAVERQEIPERVRTRGKRDACCEPGSECNGLDYVNGSKTTSSLCPTSPWQIQVV